MKNSIFNRIKNEHPNWSDEQIWTAVSLEMQSDKTISERGADIDPNDPDLLRDIINGAKEWLKAILPVIFEKVEVIFKQLLANISQWVKMGIEYIIKHIGDLFSTLKVL